MQLGQTWKKYNWLIALALIVAIFLLLRFYNLSSSLLFWGDIGRDYLTLFDWQQSWKPPLLGPQTSVLPYNQSAIYFYLLMPVFLLTQHSFLASTITLSIIYLSMLAWGLWVFRKSPQLRTSVLIVACLVAIHPEFVRQSRLVWNPSFVGPFIITSFFSFYLLSKKFTWSRLVTFALSLSLAVSLSYSVAPVFIAFLLYSLVLFRKNFQWLKIWIATGLGLTIWNLPTMVFELRHNFFLTKLLIYGEKLSQSAIGIATKTNDLSRYLLPEFSQLLAFVFGIVIVIYIIRSIQKTENVSHKPLFLAVIVFSLSVLITYMVPIGVAAHYIFGLLSLLIIIISLLPTKFSIPITIFLIVFWLQPSITNSYFQTARRNLPELTSCAQQICQTQTKPLFVSEQSNHHQFHNAIAWQYLLKSAGCDVRNLDTQIDQANTMVVIVDDSQFVFGQTAYNELTQFGAATESGQLSCSNDLVVKFLEK